MKSIVIQFHANAEELAGYVNLASSDLGLSPYMMHFKPFGINRISSDVTPDMLRVDADIEIIFTNEQLDLSADSQNGFLDRNPGLTLLSVGNLTEQGLDESGLACLSDDHGQVALAKKLATRLKKITKAGAIAVNPVSGAEANIRSHRYTEGAKSLYEEGVKILPIAGTSTYKLAG